MQWHHGPISWERRFLPKVLQAWMASIAWMVSLALTALPAAADPACDLEYHVTPRPEARPAALEVELRFAADGRRESVIRAVPSWAGVSDFAATYFDWQALGAAEAVEPLVEPFRWRVRHAPEGQVRLRWQVRTTLPDPEAETVQDQRQMYRTQIGPRGFQFFGHGVLPSVEHWGDDRQARLCLQLQPFDATSAIFGSPGRAAPGQPLVWRTTGSPALLRHAFYGGGPMWRLQERPLHGGRLAVAVRGTFTRLNETAFSDAAARLIDTQRRFWDPTIDLAQPLQWLVLTPNHSAHGNSGGTLVRDVAVLHAPTGFNERSGTFEFLVAHENLHRWIPERFGRSGGDDPVADAAAYWFSEGFTDHYTHRLLLAAGLWSLQDYGVRLTERAHRTLTSPARSLKAAEIAPRFFSDRDAGQQMYLRGEWLALRWDAALRRAGRGSLAALLQSLMTPPGSQAAVAPAWQRVLGAAATFLEGTDVDPRADLRTHIDEGVPLPLGAPEWPDPLAACFLRDEVERSVWSLGFDPRSFEERVLRGVDPAGPAYAAGLRDGMTVAGYSIHGGDVERDALIQLREAPYGDAPGRVRDVTYRPVARERQRMPRWQVKPGAQDDEECRAWISAR